MNDKVKLKRQEYTGWEAPGTTTKSVQKALPFYKSRRGTYVHRVRSMHQHWRGGEFSHAWVDFWCGNSGGVGENGTLLREVPEGDVLCATCEGRAIGAGEDGAPIINGREVRYSPRRRP